MPLLSLSLGTLLLALAVTAGPVAPSRSPLHRIRYMSPQRAFNPIQHAPARARDLMTRPSSTGIKVANANVFSAPTKDMGDIHCVAVAIGNPPKTYNLIVDTGSSNTFFIGLPSDYSVAQYDIDYGVYGSAIVAGIEYPDTVNIAGMLVNNQSIGAVQVQYGISDTGCDGILGIGPTDLTADTTFGPSNLFSSPFPTVTDNAYNQGLLYAPIVSLSYYPTVVSDMGMLTFGGVDSNRFIGPMEYVPLTNNSPSSLYWGIDASFLYGNARITIQSTTSGILDSGTTLLYVPTEVYNIIQNKTGAVFDANAGLLKVTKTQFANMESLYIVAGDVTMELIPDALSIPRSLVNDTSSDDVYLVFGNLGKEASPGFEFILGYFLHQRWYISYDSGNKRVGLASTKYTYQTVNNPSGGRNCFDQQPLLLSMVASSW